MDSSELVPTLQPSSLSQISLVPKYAKYKPRISLEILSARNASIVLVLTYFMFFASVTIIIFVSILLDYYHETLSYPSCCSSVSYTINFTETFTADSFTYTMMVTQSNFTSLKGWKVGSQSGICSPVEVFYTSNIWVCFNNNGCVGHQVSNEISSDTMSWQHLQSYEDVAITNMCILRESSGFTITVIPKIIHVTVSIHNKH